jgi:hypothetical protein
MVARKQIQMVCPSGLVRDVLDYLKTQKVGSYTLMDVRMGAGRSGETETGNLPGYAFRYLLFLVDPAHLDTLLPELEAFVQDYGGLLLVSDVQQYGLPPA